MSMSRGENADDMLVALEKRVQDAQSEWHNAEQYAANAAIHRDAARAAYVDLCAQLTQFSGYVASARAALGYQTSSIVLRRCLATRLPHDVLTQVFRYVVDAYEYEPDSPSVAHSPAYTVAHVSTHWRSIALADPQLWARFRISLSPDNYDTFSDRLNSYLARSGTKNLDILLVATPRGDNPSLNTEARTTLVCALKRCSALHLHWKAHSISVEDEIFELIQSPMPELRRLHVSHQFRELGHQVVRSAPELLSIFELSPKLIDIHLELMPFRFIDVESMPLIRSAHIMGSLGDLELVDIAEHWTALERLEMHGVRILSNSTIDPPALANLSVLKCYCHGSRHCIFEVLKRSHLINLRELHLRCNGAVPRFFTRFMGSTPWISLRKLSLVAGMVSELLRNFRLLPNVTVLELHSIARAELERFIQSWDQDTVVMLPVKLDSLYFINCEFGGGNISYLKSFLRRRRTSRGDGDALLRMLSIVQTMVFAVADDVCLVDSALERLQKEVSQVRIDTSRALVED